MFLLRVHHAVILYVHVTVGSPGTDDGRRPPRMTMIGCRGDRVSVSVTQRFLSQGRSLLHVPLAVTPCEVTSGERMRMG